MAQTQLVRGRINWGDKTTFGCFSFGLFGFVFLCFVLFSNLPNYFDLATLANEEALVRNSIGAGIGLFTAFSFFMLIKRDYTLLEFTPTTLRMRNMFDGKILKEFGLENIASVEGIGHLHFWHMHTNSLKINFQEAAGLRSKTFEVFGYGMPEWELLLQAFEQRGIPFFPEKGFFKHIVQGRDKRGSLTLTFQFNLNN